MERFPIQPFRQLEGTSGGRGGGGGGGGSGAALRSLRCGGASSPAARPTPSAGVLSKPDMELRIRADPESVSARHQSRTLSAVPGRKKSRSFYYYYYLTFLTTANASATSAKGEGSCLISTFFSLFLFFLPFFCLETLGWLPFGYESHALSQ